MAKFSVSGLRGIVGDDLTVVDFLRISNSFASFMKAEQILLGRDARVSGNMINGAVQAGLAAAGVHVLDTGMVTTPTAVFGTRACKADAGIVITASHNPWDQNGLKFLQPGRFLVPSRSEEFIHFAGAERFYQVKTDGLKQTEEVDALNMHRGALLGLFSSNTFQPRLKVGLDPVNGAAGPEAIKILESINCEVYAINFEPTGHFGRGGEPVPENLDGLKSLVKAKKLDIGFAFDPDGDRLAFVDERGLAVGEEYTVPLCTRWGLERKGGDVVVNLSTSRMIESVAEEFGANVHRTPVGEAHVVDRLLAINGSCGGEGNGGFILPEFNATRDGLLAMAVLVELCRSQGRVSTLVEALPQYHLYKEKFEIEWSEDTAGRVSSLFPSAQRDDSDGLWLGAEDFWLHLRPSNTEPVVRLLLEADSKELASRVLKEVKKICVE